MRCLLAPLLTLRCAKSCWDLRRDIDVSNDEVDEVNEGLDTPESAGPIFQHADDPVESFSDGVGEPTGLHEGDDVVDVGSNGVNKLADGLQSTLESGSCACRTLTIRREA